MFNIYLAFNFEKESNGQNHSLSDSHLLINKFPSKISHFTHWGWGFPLPLTNIFTTKIFRIILNGKTLLYSRLSWKFQRQHRDKNNSLRFHMAVNEKQSHQAREKNWWLTRIIRTEAFYKLLTLTRLENNFQCQYWKNPYGSFWYFSMLYDEVFMLFLLPALSYTTHTHAHGKEASHGPTNSKK